MIPCPICGKGDVEVVVPKGAWCTFYDGHQGFSDREFRYVLNVCPLCESFVPHIDFDWESYIKLINRNKNPYKVGDKLTAIKDYIGKNGRFYKGNEYHILFINPTFWNIEDERGLSLDCGFFFLEQIFGVKVKDL